MVRGGVREGAGRPKKPKSELAKQVTFRLYDNEKDFIREVIKYIRADKENMNKIQELIKENQASE